MTGRVDDEIVNVEYPAPKMMAIVEPEDMWAVIKARDGKDCEVRWCARGSVHGRRARTHEVCWLLGVPTKYDC